MKLIMFDIDGTLVDSSNYDGSSYEKAIKEVFKIREVNQDWSTYKHATDQGILNELANRLFERDMTKEEELNIKELLKIEFENKYKEDKNSFKEIKGAIEIFEYIKGRNDFHLSIATGCWEGSALFKLGKTGFDITGVPMATSDDAVSREDIMKVGEKKSREFYKKSSYEKIIYFGDGEWDLKATGNIGYNFIGIGHRIKSLAAKGAEYTFENFEDRDAIIKLIENI